MVKPRAIRGTGPYGNGAAPLQVDSLRAAGLTLVRHLDAHGKPCGDAVIPVDELPRICVTSQPRPARPCGACHSNRWRLDRGTMTSFICGRCHP